MAADRIADGRGLIALVREITEDGLSLVRGEMRLARLEAGEAAREIGTRAALVATGAVLALLGGLSLVIGLVLLAGDQWLPTDRYWLAALIMAAISAAVAVVFARRGLARVTPAALEPDQTMTTLKEDVKWVQRRLTSGVTSS